MNKIIYLFLSLIMVGCSSGHMIFELSSREPISTDCAYSAIRELKAYDFVDKKENEIEFYNKSYGGSLFHGGESRFTNYGIELKTSPPLGPNLKEVSDRIVEAINAKCAGNA